VVDDPNVAAASLLYDMSVLQTNEHSELGYRRAAKAIVALPMAVGDLVRDDRLREVPFVGPSSIRIVREFVETGRSATLDQALANSGRSSKVATLRALRSGS